MSILAMENHYKDGYWRYPEFAQSPDIFCDILDRIDDRVHFGVQYDPSNAILAGADPSISFAGRRSSRDDAGLGPSVAAWYRLPDVLAHDAAGYSADLQHGVIGRGLNDYPAIFRLLVDAGYDGWISIEDGVTAMTTSVRLPSSWSTPGSATSVAHMRCRWPPRHRDAAATR